MSATPPEANTEYSRGGTAARRRRFAVRGPLSSSRAAVLAGGLVGALLLIVAEFTTLYSVNAAGRYVVPIQTETGGAHNAYAMLPIALLAALLAVAAYWTDSRPALLALCALGVAAVLIAVVGDLPDTHAHGLTPHNQLASNSAGVGLYLETLGAVFLLLTGGLGLAAFAPRRPHRQPPLPHAGAPTERV